MPDNAPAGDTASSSDAVHIAPSLSSAGRRAGAPPSIPDHELLHLIGRGSYGEVWLARNALGSLRAVKVVYRKSFDHGRPYEREFEGLKKFEPISHARESQVDIFHVGRNDEAGFFYYIMELADQAERSDGVAECWSNGTKPAQHSNTPALQHSDSYIPRTLKHDLRTRGALPVAECVQIALSLTRALEHLHAHGLVHRDIKPSNIIFVNGVPKLADIGLVTSVDATRSFVGTDGYIPPEGPGTPPADLYSLGKVLYECVTGKDRLDFPELPADCRTRPDFDQLLEFNEILTKACDAVPTERYHFGQEMHAELELLQGGKSIKHRRKAEWRWIIGRRIGLRASAALLLAISVWGISLFLSRQQPPRASSPMAQMLAVLPFDDESLNPSGGNSGERLTEEIRTGLARVPGLGVMGRITSTAFKTSPDRAATARTNYVRALLEGRVRKQDDRLQLVLELVETRSGRILWSDILEGKASDPFGLQIEVMQRVPEALGLRLTDTQKADLMVRPTRSLEAQSAYWTGYHTLRGAKSLADVEVAIAALRRATEIDPKFALAFAQLSLAYQLPPERADQQPEPNLTFAREAVARALTLDPKLPEAHQFLAMIKESYDFDWVEADREYARAVELNPNFAEARANYAIFLLHRGRDNEAKAHQRIAAELDPLAAWIIANVGHERLKQGHPDEAIQQFKRALELGHDPNFHRWIAETYSGLGRHDEAVTAYENYWRERGEPQSVVEELRAAYAADGWPGYWKQRLEQIERGSARYTLWWAKAQMHARLGNTNAVLECLEKSYRNREYFVAQMKSNEEFKPFRSDPRFNGLLRRMNLEP